MESWRAAIHDGTAEEQGWPRWINVPSKVAQVAAARAVAARRRAADLAEGTLLAAVCPGLVDTRASRPWFDDFSRAQTPEQAARAVLDLILAGRPDPATDAESSPAGLLSLPIGEMQDARRPWQGVRFALLYLLSIWS